MKGFVGIAFAGLLATAAALPTNDKHDDHKEVQKHEDNKYDDGKWDDKKYDDGKKHDDKHDDGKWDDGKQASEWKKDSLNAFPFEFTSTYYAHANPDTIINNDGESVPGQKGAKGWYSFGINAWQEVICYNITLEGVTGDYQSPAATATHIHEAPAGEAGPPRLAFPNPTGDDWKRTSFGCLKGPFKTGLNGPNGQDTATGFKLGQIESNPSGFFADVHTSQFVAGAVRGQLQSHKDW